MPLTIAFHLDNFNERGVVRSTVDYADLTEQILGHKSVIVAPNGYSCNFSLCPSIMEQRVRERFPVFMYSKTQQLDQVLKKAGADFLYVQKEGSKKGVWSNHIPTGVHCIFLEGEPHGARFAGISKWLAQELSIRLQKDIPFVSLPISGTQKPVQNLRRRLRIPQKATVFGRYGGYASFNLTFVHRTIEDILRIRPDVYFLFMNTEPFLKHPRIIYLPASVHIQHKVDFIHACDAMIHARARGESFGLSVAEFLYQGNPVFAWHDGIDKNHCLMLEHTRGLYKNARDLQQKILAFDRNDHSPEQYKQATQPYRPEVVMKQFEEVFLFAL